MSNQSFSWNPELTAHFNGAPELTLLDLDGTLINSIPDLTIATDSMLAKLGLPLAGTEKVSHWVGNGIDKLVRRALANGVEEQALALSKDALSAARIHFDAAYLDALTSATGAYPGVEEWLNTVTIPKVLITNKARVFTEPIIESLGWNKHFVQIICGDDLADKKPSPLPLLHACKGSGEGFLSAKSSPQIICTKCLFQPKDSIIGSVNTRALLVINTFGIVTVLSHSSTPG